MEKSKGQKRQTRAYIVSTLVFIILFALGSFLVYRLFGIRNIFSSFLFLGINVAIAGFASIRFHDLLSLFYVRESDNELNSAFYSDNAWLDVDDHNLVLVDAGRIYSLSFEKRDLKKIQSAFAENSATEEMLKLFPEESQKRVALENIVKVTSRHDEDSIEVGALGGTLELDFLNLATKKHALDVLSKRFPASLSASVTHKTRLQSAAPRLLALVALIAISVFAPDARIWAVMGFLALVLLPKLVKRLVSPTVLHTWEKTESTAPVANSATEDDMRKAA